MKPKIISTEKIYNGRVFDLSSVEIRDGTSEYKREIISHAGSAVIVPILGDHTILLVRQYRHAAEKYLLELPAGTINKGESPEECAVREVEEEVGFKTDKVEKLTEFYVSPGFLTEKMHLYLATRLTRSEQNLDDDEILCVKEISFEEAFAKIISGEIEDAKTIIGLIFSGKRFGFAFNP